MEKRQSKHNGFDFSFILLSLLSRKFWISSKRILSHKPFNYKQMKMLSAKITLSVLISPLRVKAMELLSWQLFMRLAEILIFWATPSHTWQGEHDEGSKWRKKGGYAEKYQSWWQRKCKSRSVRCHTTSRVFLWASKGRSGKMIPHLL